jgi:hypothetical protein
VVYSRTGSGFATTAPFTVHARRWTVAFDNQGGFFQAFLLKNGVIQSQVISATRHGVVSHLFSGASTFQLKIAGSGDWMVQVHDGS